MKKIVRLAAVAISLVALAAGPALANHAWATYHWARTANPFTIKLGDNVNASWDAYLGNAAADWQITSGACNNASNPVRTSIVAGQVSNLRRCTAVSGKVQVCNYTYGNNGWLGLASISVSGGHITAGTVKLNDTYYNTASYNTPAWRRLVMEQEVGHCLGLTHQDENQTNADLLDACGRGSCMDYSNDPANQGTPNQHDYDQLVTIYGHLDATTTIGASVPANQGFSNDLGRGNADRQDEADLESVDPDNQASWGMPEPSSRGRAHTFVREFGNGRKVITHVFWAE